MNTEYRKRLPGTDLDYFDTRAAVDAIQPGAYDTLPYTSRILAEQLVRRCEPAALTDALKQLIEGQGGVVECRTDGAKLPAGNRFGYVGNARIEDLDDAKMIQLIGTNPAVEAPVLNARIRKAWSNGAPCANWDR